MSTERRPFSVITFSKDQSVAAVPTLWIDKLGVCSWPKKRPSNFRDLVRNPSFEPPESWEKWKVEVVKTYDEFEKADDKATKYVKTNQVESSDGEGLRKKRKRVKEKSDPVFATPDDPFNQAPSVVKVPEQLLQDSLKDFVVPASVPPSFSGVPSLTSNESFLARNNLRLISFAQESEDACVFVPQASTSRQFVEPVQVPVFSSVADLESQNFSSYTSGCQVPVGLRQEEPFATAPGRASICTTPTPTGVRSSYSTLLEEFRAFQIASIRGQEELKSEIRDLRKLLTQVLSNVNPVVSTNCADELPLNLEETFKSFNENLKDKSTFDQLVTFFSKIGGSCLSKCVYNILKRTISRDLQGKLRYTSQSGKVCFGDSLLADAIREAVLKTPTLKEPTSSDVNFFMARWFRNWTNPLTKDGRVKKNQKKTNSAGCSSESPADPAASSSVVDFSGSDSDGSGPDLLGTGYSANSNNSQ